MSIPSKKAGIEKKWTNLEPPLPWLKKQERI